MQTYSVDEKKSFENIEEKFKQLGTIKGKSCLMEINKKYLPAIGRIFSPLVLDSIAEKGYSSYLAEVCRNSGLVEKIDRGVSLGGFFDWTYNFLFKNYRNEYIYKNVIANKLLLNRHSLSTTKMLTEFRVGSSKADVVLLNGASTVYEIKSQYDSFARLKKQIGSYIKVFDYINVITSSPQSNKLEDILPEKIGILVLTDRHTISTIRKAKSNKDNIIPEVLFNSLRKNEYLNVIKEYYGKIPNVPNTYIYRECKKLFCKIPPICAHDLAVTALKNRNCSDYLSKFIIESPASISAYAVSVCSKKNVLMNLLNQFQRNFNSFVTISSSK
jgi:hypothetical protein